MKLDSVFRCSRCQKCLSSWYFEKNGELFCKQDYWTLYGDSCNRCGLIITGPVMVRGGILHAWDHLRRRGLQARSADRSSARTLNQGSWSQCLCKYRLCISRTCNLALVLVQFRLAYICNCAISRSSIFIYLIL